MKPILPRSWSIPLPRRMVHCGGGGAGGRHDGWFAGRPLCVDIDLSGACRLSTSEGRCELADRVVWRILMCAYIYSGVYVGGAVCLCLWRCVGGSCAGKGSTTRVTIVNITTVRRFIPCVGMKSP